MWPWNAVPLHWLNEELDAEGMASSNGAGCGDHGHPLTDTKGLIKPTEVPQAPPWPGRSGAVRGREEIWKLPPHCPEPRVQTSAS